VDNGHWERSHPDIHLLKMRWGYYGDPIYSMRDSVLGNAFMASQLRAVRASVEKEGELTEAAIQSVRFQDEPYLLTKDLETLRSQLQQNPEGLEVSALRSKQKEQALAYLDGRLRSISCDKSDCEEREKKEEEARQAAAVLPSPEVLDKILRYETKLERQLFRAMNQLERLQRMRRGEAVPPPMTMEVSERH
jgi:hypothetical protein